MPASSSLQSLLAQFQTCYPIGCLTAELLTTHQEQYLVRAIVQMGGARVATAMAADASLEAAEDRAKLRVLAAILPAVSPPTLDLSRAKLEPVPTVPQPLASSPLTSSPLTSSPLASSLAMPPLSPLPPDSASGSAPQPTFGAALTEPVSSEPAPFAAATTSAQTNQPTWEAEFQSFSQPSAAAMEPSVELEPVKASATGLRSSKAERASKRAADPFPESSEPLPTPPPTVEPPAAAPAAPAAPADRSEEIMRIGIEMKRLGWSTEQGREYLKRTYGKASRSKLDDAELLDFLHYLEIQASPLQAQTPF